MRFFSYSNNAPDAKIILNRKSDAFFCDISSDILSFSTSNNINDLNGSFTVNIDNTNDKYVDRFGYVKFKEMSSIEIFAKNDSSVGDVNSLEDTFVTTKENETVHNLVERLYNVDMEKDLKELYVNQIIELNKMGATADFPSSTDADFPMPAGLVLKIPGLLIEYKRIF